MKRLFFALLVLMTPTWSGACGSIDHARLDLKKWGLSYCLMSFLPEDEALLDQAAIAMGGYFQVGEHDDEAAYQAVRRFFNAGMKDVPVSKHDGKSLPYMACLDLYESPEFDRLIREQDRFVSE